MIIIIIIINSFKWQIVIGDVHTLTMLSTKRYLIDLQ